ncbi:peroxiredoxin-6 isoform X1 [Gadus morhua]|uniref:Peroxiredoxin-6 n=1 Tax=Gadus morhua TaxID=8049 RepID=A0A8C5AW93_GADMO|nr:peroxiredoxin-6-like isoform X1 [Gadus morhua]XP_056453718.1 peroxiredoxin-6-like isoform X1 [Gadus chalcogrammus]XP_059915728.1 peroxiredoxin-6-like isoform X1 [Gadus macrocephalus]XP_059915729.1 peroxiredoxin-6-like isoform X1 [Gadus macrocephalus]
MPGLLLGDVFPNFHAETTDGSIQFHDFLGDSWCVLFSHPGDFTPVCTTELGRAARLCAEFTKRGVKMVALSVDSLEDHHDWSKDILAYCSMESERSSLPYPVIADQKRELALALGMMDPDEKDKDGLPLTARCVRTSGLYPVTLQPCSQLPSAVFIIGPDKRLKLSLLYPASTGRNFDEILRVVDSLQLTATKRVATPADWQPGDSVMVPPSMSEAEASVLFPAGVFTKEVPSKRKYLRYTPQP